MFLLIFLIELYQFFNNFSSCIQTRVKKNLFFFTPSQDLADEIISFNACISEHFMQSKASRYVEKLANNDSMSSAYNVNIVNVSKGRVGSFKVTSKPTLDMQGELKAVVTIYDKLSMVSSAINVPSSSGLEVHGTFHKIAVIGTSG